MSDDSTLPSESSPAEEMPSKPVKKNVRRISHKPAAVPSVVVDAVSPETVTTQPDSETEGTGSDWPEFESLGDDRSQEGAKRNKRRRRKGKGGGQSPVEAPTAMDEPAGESTGTAPAPRPAPPAAAQRPKADPELLAKFAWKIYLAEVSEEGVALIGDNDARELSRRCFRLAEIFLEEQVRRR